MTMLEHNNARIENQLATWGARLDELVAATQKAGSETGADYRRRLDDLKTKHEAARSRFTEARIAGGSALDTFTTGAGSAWTELENGFKKLAK